MLRIAFDQVNLIEGDTLKTGSPSIRIRLKANQDILGAQYVAFCV